MTARQNQTQTQANIVIVATVRAAGLFLLWLALTRGNRSDIVAGLLATLLATWISLRLLPVARERVRLTRLVPFVIRFLYQSVVAGIDVAARAMHPRLPLRPGFVVYQPLLPEGTRRAAFCTVTSLLPGTLPCGTSGADAIAIHCLDISQGVASQLRDEELRLSQTCAGGTTDG